MIRIHVFCEGQTEETFTREVLYRHFIKKNINLNRIVLGGIHSYGQIKSQILRKAKEDKNAWVTTFIDLYGLPHDFPGQSQNKNLLEKINTILTAFKKDINQPNFIPYLSIHEFEALLFSDTKKFKDLEDCYDNKTLIAHLIRYAVNIKHPNTLTIQKRPLHQNGLNPYVSSITNHKMAH